MQREFVALPGDRLTTLGHITPGRPAPPQDDPPIVTRQDAPAGSWRPTPVTAGPLDLADPLDRRVARVLDGTDPAPPWWPRDDSGYAVAKRDLDFLGIAPRQLAWLLRRQAPLGMTPPTVRPLRHPAARSPRQGRHRPLPGGRQAQGHRRRAVRRAAQDVPGGGSADAAGAGAAE
ncbi:hypothetical protein [Nonomuraea salmonea]|uniref:hypothetical protein n=1 Tax=Nonomuraea salmonea TaxID=46181 RepID=UPI0031E52106